MQYPTHAITALKQESFSKFPEIVAFGKKLSHSFQAAQVGAAAVRVGAVHLMLIQVQVLCGWGAFTDKCGGSVSAAECRTAMSTKGGDVSSREILNGKLSSGLDALVGLSEEEKLNDNRDFNCLVHDCDFKLLFGSIWGCHVADGRTFCFRSTGWARLAACQLRACGQVSVVSTSVCELQKCMFLQSICLFHPSQICCCCRS